MAEHTPHITLRVPEAMRDAYRRVCEQLGVTRTDDLIEHIRRQIIEHGDAEAQAALAAADVELAERRSRKGGRPRKDSSPAPLPSPPGESPLRGTGSPAVGVCEASIYLNTSAFLASHRFRLRSSFTPKLCVTPVSSSSRHCRSSGGSPRGSAPTGPRARTRSSQVTRHSGPLAQEASGPGFGRWPDRNWARSASQDRRSSSSWKVITSMVSA